MDPVRIRHWGLWPITRRTYLISQAGVVLSWLALLVVYLLLPKPLPRTPQGIEGATLFAWTLLRWIPSVLIVVAIWFVIDLLIVLRLFARKEAERKAHLASAEEGEERKN